MHAAAICMPARGCSQPFRFTCSAAPASSARAAASAESCRPRQCDLSFKLTGAAAAPAAALALARCCFVALCHCKSAPSRRSAGAAAVRCTAFLAAARRAAGSPAAGRCTALVARARRCLAAVCHSGSAPARRRAAAAAARCSPPATALRSAARRAACAAASSTAMAAFRSASCRGNVSETVLSTSQALKGALRRHKQQ